MRILIIGGTRFVGLAIARTAIERGHDVSLFHRSAAVPLGTESARHLLGDRTKDFSALQVGEWDAVIDVCGYRPHEIHAMYDVLAGRMQKYVFISTISVYDAHIPAMSNESAAFCSTESLLAGDPITVPNDAKTYGPLKVLCEAAVEQHYPDHLHIRPTFVIGPDDYTDRFTKWVKRVQAGGVVDVPEPQDAKLQFIDARDLAQFTLQATEADRRGPVHVAAPSGGIAFGAVMQQIRDVVGPTAAELNWLPLETATARAAEFPLWAGGRHFGMRELDTSRAEAWGLSARPLANSIQDLL